MEASESRLRGVKQSAKMGGLHKHDGSYGFNGSPKLSYHAPSERRGLSPPSVEPKSAGTTRLARLVLPAQPVPAIKPPCTPFPLLILSPRFFAGRHSAAAPSPLRFPVPK